jgi:O-antigen ligase
MFATNALVAMVIAAYFAVVTRSLRIRCVLGAVAGLLALAIMLTLSRATSLVTALSLAYMTFRLRRRVPVIWTVIVMLLIALCLVPFIPADYYQRMASLFTEEAKTDMSLFRRNAYNVIAWRLFLRSPVWGVGPNGFIHYYTANAFRTITDTADFGRYCHNTYLGVLCETGLLGLAAFTAIVWLSFRDLSFVVRSYGRRADGFLKQSAEALHLALFAFLLSSLFLPNLYKKYMWLMFALCGAMAHIRRRQLAREAGPRTPSDSPS